MLSLKYLRPDPFQEMCNVQCSEKDSGKKLSLQARVIRWIFHKRKRASCFGSCRASVTVEASLVFPIFLCAVACFIGLAQMILVETEVHYAVSQTAKICAKQQMFSLIPEEDDQKSNQVKEDNGIHKSDRTNGRQSIRNASSVFFDIYDAPIDTTFALYKPGIIDKRKFCDAIRTGGEYVARHNGWYVTEQNQNSEYFKDGNISSTAMNSQAMRTFQLVVISNLLSKQNEGLYYIIHRILPNNKIKNNYTFFDIFRTFIYLLRKKIGLYIFSK